MVRGLTRGCFMEPTKRILVILEHNVNQSDTFFRGVGIKLVTNSCYLGGVHWVIEVSGDVGGG